MASSLFGLLSFLRPDDANLSERQRWLVQAYRVLSTVAAALIPVFGLLYQILPSEYVDPWGPRLLMAGLVGGVCTLSYVSAWGRRHFTTLVWGCLYVLVARVS